MNLHVVSFLEGSNFASHESRIQLSNAAWSDVAAMCLKCQLLGLDEIVQAIRFKSALKTSLCKWFLSRLDPHEMIAWKRGL